MRGEGRWENGAIGEGIRHTAESPVLGYVCPEGQEAPGVREERLGKRVVIVLGVVAVGCLLMTMGPALIHLLARYTYVRPVFHAVERGRTRMWVTGRGGTLPRWGRPRAGRPTESTKIAAVTGLERVSKEICRNVPFVSSGSGASRELVGARNLIAITRTGAARCGRRVPRISW